MCVKYNNYMEEILLEKEINTPSNGNGVSHMNESSINLIKFENVKYLTTEDYFNNNKFSIDAFNKKYTLTKEDGALETYVEALKRVCDYIASVEKTKELKKYWAERWFDEIFNDWWHPAGSITQGANCGKKISLANCTTISLGIRDEDIEWDTLESIIKNTAYTVAKSAAYRQGLGIDFSRIRPIGAKVLNSANESTGSIHWMRFIDSIGNYVGQRGRIPAMLFSLNISHPDVEEFITVKSDYTKIQNANISVQITNDFYDFVKKDGDWELFFDIPEVKKDEKVYIDIHSITKDSLYDEKKSKYYYIAKHNRPGERITKMVRAKELLELISKNMTNNAEPGIQNIDVARKYSNSDYVYDPNDEYDSRIFITNAFSEQYLSRESLCVLGSLNMGKFSTDKENYDKELKKIGYSINRFLDNVNECELTYHTYATPHQKLSIEKLRRTGAGYTNVAGWLFKKNLEYGSKEGNKEIEEFTKTYNYYLYKSSIDIGKEKGNFGLFNREKLEKSPFIKRMKTLGLEFDTLRNVTNSSIAPTGTLNLMFRDSTMSYGIEPGFGIYYWKRTRITGKYEYYFCVPKVVRDVFKEKGYEIPMKSDTIKDTWDGKYGKPIVDFIEEHKSKIGIKFKNATEILPLDKLNLMSKVMNWIDSSISVTYLLPENSDWKNVYDFILEAHKKEVKSIATFPDRKMYGIVSFLPFKELAIKLISEGVGIHEQNFSEDELKTLNILSKPSNKIQKTQAPKRPNGLECDVYNVTALGKKWLVIVGLLDKQPYEVFGLKLKKIHLPSTVKKGKLIKLKRGVYNLELDSGFVLEDLTSHFDKDEHETLTRMISTTLRHGCDIKFICEQLDKSEGTIVSFGKAISRTLRKYVQNTEEIEHIEEKCPSCEQENTLIRQEGCVSCSACQWSKC